MTTRADSKTCPACAEEVKVAATICRFCDYDFTLGMRSRSQVPTKTSGVAIASLILGILWLYGIGSIIAIVLGHNARRDIEASEGRLQGSGLATAGIVLGWIGIGLTILFVWMLAQM